MRKLKIILSLLCILSFQNLIGQSNLALIEEKYRQLDSVTYLNNLKDAIRGSSTYFFEKPTEDTVNRINEKIKNGINGYNIKFVLRVDLDTSSLNSNNYLLLDDSTYPFDIYCYDDKFNPRFFVYFNKNELDNFGNGYQSIEVKYAKKLKGAIKRILKKNPKHILFSYFLPNSILYVKDDKILVYRVIQKEVYELDDYVSKFKDSNFFYRRD